MKKLSWTVRFETTTGVVKVARWHAASVSEAIDLTVSEYSGVANILSVHDAKRVRWL